jgi:hypothetical protein
MGSFIALFFLARGLGLATSWQRFLENAVWNQGCNNSMFPPLHFHLRPHFCISIFISIIASSPESIDFYPYHHLIATSRHFWR